MRKWLKSLSVVGLAASLLVGASAPVQAQSEFDGEEVSVGIVPGPSEEVWNEANDGSLTGIGYTFVSPMGAYSENIESLDDLQEGDTIAIPNDPTNGGRALLGLELAGVIEVDDEVGPLATVNDITDNPLNLEFEELDAAQLALSLPDVAAAFINLNFATDAGLSLDEAIFVD